MGRWKGGTWVMPHVIDSGSPDSPVVLDLLLDAAAAWAQGGDVEETAASLRSEAILRNHRHYFEHIPVYRDLATARGIGLRASVAEVSNELMFTTDVFKSYDRRWLAEGDFVRMTEWLGTIFSGAVGADAGAASTVDAWRRCLAGRGVYVTCSSGTSGKVSFVPRDAATLDASSSNGWCYAAALPAMTIMERAGFDCLVLGPRGTGTGMQAASMGVARAAARSHFLLDEVPRLGADGVARRARGGRARDGAYREALRFLGSSISDARPVVVFSTPAALGRMCAWMIAEGTVATLPAGSIAITGGGWKSVSDGALDHDDLAERVEHCFGIPHDYVVDMYSTAETSFFCPRCRAGRYHVPPFVEIVLLDDTLTPADRGEGYGLIGFLDPFATSYPGFLVTGDEARVVFDLCPCGLTGWALDGPIRRAPEFGHKGCAGVIEALIA